MEYFRIGVIKLYIIIGFDIYSYEIFLMFKILLDFLIIVLIKFIIIDFMYVLFYLFC